VFKLVSITINPSHSRFILFVSFMVFARVLGLAYIILRCDLNLSQNVSSEILSIFFPRLCKVRINIACYVGTFFYTIELYLMGWMTHRQVGYIFKQGASTHTALRHNLRAIIYKPLLEQNSSCANSNCLTLFSLLWDIEIKRNYNVMF